VDGSLIWITDWGVWPSEENPCLIDKFREAYGEKRALIDAPGHLFDPSEQPAISALFRLVLLFGWDGHLIPKSKVLYFSAIHDGYLDILSSDATRLTTVRGWAKKAGFTELAVASGQ
jgi:hypothetical protein